jgi:hypothetical protein
MDSLSMKIFGPAATLLANTFALLLIRFATYRAMHVWVKKTATKLDDIIIDSIKNPSLLFAVATGAYISLSFSEIPEKHMLYIDKILSAGIILSMTFALADPCRSAVQKLRSDEQYPCPDDRTCVRHFERDYFRYRFSHNLERFRNIDSAPDHRLGCGRAGSRAGATRYAGKHLCRSSHPCGKIHQDG